MKAAVAASLATGVLLLAGAVLLARREAALARVAEGYHPACRAVDEAAD